jgi:hypothetical protein
MLNDIKSACPMLFNICMTDLAWEGLRIRAVRMADADFHELAAEDTSSLKTG